MRIFPALLRTLLVVLSLAVMMGVPTVSGAQGGTAKEIFKITCPSDPGPVSAAAGLPEECDTVEGVTYTVTTPDGTALDSCTTNANGHCFAILPGDPDDPILIYEDLATTPPGFAPRENPIESTVGAGEFNAEVFVNLPGTTVEPTPEPTAEPPKELPDTGAGPRASGDRGAAWLLLAVAGLAGVGLVAQHQRRGQQQRP